MVPLLTLYNTVSLNITNSTVSATTTISVNTMVSTNTIVFTNTVTSVLIKGRNYLLCSTGRFLNSIPNKTNYP